MAWDGNVAHPFNAWANRVLLPVQNGKVAVNETNFWMPVTDGVPAAVYADSKADATDWVFTLADGTTQLDCTKVSFDQVANTCQFWVLVPAIDSAVDTNVYLYYNNPAGAEAQNTGCPHAAHWCLEDLTDISANANTLTNVNAATFDAAKIKNGAHVNGTSQYLYTTTVAPFASIASGVIAGWCHIDNTSLQNEHVWNISRTADATNTYVVIVFDQRAVKKQIYSACVVDGAVKWAARTAINSILPLIGTTFHMAWVHNGIEPSVKINGVDWAVTFTSDIDRTPWMSALISGATSKSDIVTFGARDLGGAKDKYFDGQMDNLIITSNGDVWSDNEATNHYNAENDPDTFYVFGVPEDQPTTPVPVDDGRFWGISKISNSIGIGIR